MTLFQARNVYDLLMDNLQRAGVRIRLYHLLRIGLERDGAFIKAVNDEASGEKLP